MPTIKFHTLGCKVNQYESQAVRESCLKKGFKEAKNGKADFYVINTCTVTGSADRKSRECIYRCIRENPKATVAVTGCYVQKDIDEITKIPGVNLIHSATNPDACHRGRKAVSPKGLKTVGLSLSVSTLSIPRINLENKPRYLPSGYTNVLIIPNAQKNRIADMLSSKDSKTASSLTEDYLDLEISDFSDHDKAFVKIQDGCDNRCSYCKIPIVRGKSLSRNLDSIVREASRLIRNGFQEIVLTGICLGAFGKDLKEDLDLVSVIEAIEKLDTNFRIRLSSIEAKDVTDKLIDKIAGFPKMCRHLHIPFQSGDNEMLKKMYRNYNTEFYRNLIKRIRNRIPQIAITTDIMVGFPMETDKRFENTRRFLKEVSPSRMHIFPFSPREYTAAFQFGNTVNSETKKKRLMLLKDLARDMSYAYRKQFLHKELMVLVEQKKDKKTGLAQGYSDNYIKILINSNKPFLPNKLQKVKITAVTQDTTLSTAV